MIWSMIATVGSVAAIGSVFVMAQPDSNDYDVKIVEAETPRWRDARDLLVLLDATDDRVGFSRAIVNASLSSTTLTDEQRYDGLRVAGNALFYDGQSAESVSALSSAANYTDVAAKKAEVIGTAAEVYVVGLNDRDSGYAMFKQAADLYKQSDPAHLDKVMVDGVFRGLVSMAFDRGEYEVVDEYAADAISMSEHLPYGGLNLGFYRYTAASAAEKLGDAVRAASLFSEFLAHHPTYGNDRPQMGIVPHAKVQKAIAEGSFWDKPDERLINTVLEILRNPAYAKMPVRLNFAERLAFVWDEKFALEASLALRDEIASQAQADLDLLDPDSPKDAMLGRAVWREFAISQTNGAAAVLERDPSRAIVMLDRVLASSPFAWPELVLSAEAFRDQAEAME